MTMNFTFGSADKESACNARDLDLIHGLGRSLEKGKFTYSSLLVWRIPWIHGVAKSRTLLSDFHFHFAYMKYAFLNLNYEENTPMFTKFKILLTLNVFAFYFLVLIFLHILTSKNTGIEFYVSE